MRAYVRPFLTLLVGAMLCASGNPSRAAEVPELVGVSAPRENVRVVLLDPETRASSGWLALGDRFAGFLLKTYDRTTETLVLERDGAEVRLRLRAAAIQPPLANNVLSLEAGGVMKLGERVITLSDLRREIAAGSFTSAEGVRIVVHSQSSADSVLEILDLLRAGGINRISLQARQRSSNL